MIGKWTSNPHTIIWIAAILFSAFHLQFYGFLPRMILGAYFGYLLYWSKSIWIPVFAHFVNNAFAVIGMSDSRLKDNEFVTGDIPAEHLLTLSYRRLIFPAVHTGKQAIETAAISLYAARSLFPNISRTISFSG